MRRKSKYTLNEYAFDKLDDAASYWLGVLIADGSVDHLRGISRLRLGLKDTKLVEQFRDFLGSNHPIKDRGDVRILEVTSHYLVAAIEQYGIVPNKTKIATAHSDLVGRASFWRGVIDGDGCTFTRNGYPNIVLVGSEPLMDQWLAFVKDLVDTSARVRPDGSIFRVCLGGHRYSALVEVLKGTPCLSRKWDSL